MVAGALEPPAFDPLDFDGTDLDDADLDDADFDDAGLEGDFEREDADPFDEPDRLAGVLFLDDPQLDMSPPPYQPLTRQGRYPDGPPNGHRQRLPISGPTRLRRDRR